MDIGSLSAAKLQKAIDAADKRCRTFVDAMIDSGRGHELMNETRANAAKGHDSLAIDYCDAMDDSAALEREKQARIRYHGSMKPIKRQA
jgi:hypothetical protein